MIAIMAMATLMVPPVYARLVPSYELRQYANDIAYAARLARQEARLMSKITELRVDEAKGVVDLLGASEKLDRLDISGDVQVAFSEAFSDITVKDGSILFYPTGASTGGTITLTRGNLEVLVKVDWVSGAVEVQQ